MTTRQEGYLVRTSIRVLEKEPTERDLRLVLGLLGLGSVILFFACWGFAHALVVVHGWFA